jgi:MFS family permease
LGLISTFSKSSGQTQFIIFMAIEGIGIGFFSQISTVIAQNAVEIKDIATATATVQFFRTIGGVFGVTYGSLYEMQYVKSHTANLTGPPDMAQIYSDAITNVFLYAIPFAGAGFILSFFVERVALRKTTEPVAAE